SVCTERGRTVRRDSDRHHTVPDDDPAGGVGPHGQGPAGATVGGDASNRSRTPNGRRNLVVLRSRRFVLQVPHPRDLVVFRRIETFQGGVDPTTRLALLSVDRVGGGATPGHLDPPGVGG